MASTRKALYPLEAEAFTVSSVGDSHTARKRIRYDGIDDSISPITAMNYPSSTAAASLGNPSSSPSPSHFAVPKRDAVLESEIASLKAEIEQLQSLRRLDAAKFQSTEQRLKRYIVTLEQDANDARNLSDDIRNQYEKLVEESSKKKKEDTKRFYAAEQTILNLERQVEQLRSKERLLVSSSSSTLSTFKKSYTAFSSHDDDDVEEQEENDNEYDYEDCDTNKNMDDYDSPQTVEQLQICLGMLDKKNTLLQKRIDNYSNQIESFKQQLKISEEKRVMAESQLALKGLDSSSSSSSTPNKKNNVDHNQSPVSPAPRELLLELNYTRLHLADAQRLIRQQNRTLEDLQNKAKQVSLAKDIARRNEARAENLEVELATLRKERDTFQHVQKVWSDWLFNIHQKQERWLPAHKLDLLTREQGNSTSTITFSTPPEMVAIQNLILAVEEKYSKLEREYTQSKQELHASQKQVTALHDQIQQSVAAMEQIVLEKKQTENKLLQVEKQFKILQAQEVIWRKESDGLRDLLATYKLVEDQMLSKNKADVTSSTLLENRHVGENATISGLQISLNASRDQVQVLEKEMMTLKSEWDIMTRNHNGLQEEHDRVLNKFHMLREALVKEREKVAEAETRALQAELLAGKGSFNEDTTKVLHLRSNPLLNALREKYEQEIRGLKNALEESSKDVSSSNRGESSLPGLDPQKYNQRLKDNFRKQIGIFRESVYLITGYKIDMLTDTTERPRFKVRSMYAEREEDHLLFIWPALDEGELPKSLDLLDSDMAQALINDPCFKAMTQFHSIPAFTAGLTLSLFEKQTIVGS